MKLFFTTCLCFCLSLAGFSQDNKATQNARKLLEVSGSANIGTQMMNTLLASYQQELPNVPKEFWENFAKEMNPAEMTELIVPIYTKYFTADELQQLINFYQTPIGKKMVATLPLITQDSYKVGEEWGKKMAEKVISQLREKGIIPKN